jgi:hypothetical protein
MPEEIGWYISDIHCNNAIRYFHAKLAEEGFIGHNFPMPLFAELWAEALQETMDVDAPSPIGPDQETARKFLMATIEGRLSRVEERADHIEEAITMISKWLGVNLTHWGRSNEQRIERLLYGPTAASEASTQPTS